MRLQLLFVTACVIAGSLLAPSSASAQSSDPFFADFSANYDIVYHERDETSNLGGHFDIATTIKRDVPFLVLAGEVGINHFDGGNVSSYLGGLRLRLPNLGPNVLPFLQALIGLYHCGSCDINDFALQGGGGLDFRLARRSPRIRAQIDVRHMFDKVEGFNAVRVSLGLVFPLNK